MNGRRELFDSPINSTPSGKNIFSEAREFILKLFHSSFENPCLEATFTGHSLGNAEMNHTELGKPRLSRF